MRRRTTLILAIAMVLSPLGSRGQTVIVPTRDPQAVSLINRALGALNVSNTIQDVTVLGTVMFTVGSDVETGNAKFEAKGNGRTHIWLNLTGGPREEVVSNQTAADPSSGLPGGNWIGPDAVWHRFALHNCWNRVIWFDPALLLQDALADSQISMTYVGTETRNGTPVQHVRLARVVPGQISSVTALIQRVSALDIYLDTQSYAPSALGFNLHADDDALTDIPVEIRFGAYSADSSGVNRPRRIQKLIQGIVALDIYTTGSSSNTGVPDSDFATQ
jgi:hypothetical protein